jgi:hypothetical protein
MSRWAAVGLLGVLPAALGGCVERVLSIRTDPPGARVTMDDRRVGASPCDVPFIWYGQRRIAVEMRGYQGVQELVVLDPPWWQYWGMDFLTDVLLPFTLTDQREVTYVLKRPEVSPQELEEVKQRASELRERSGLPR